MSVLIQDLKTAGLVNLFIWVRMVSGDYPGSGCTWWRTPLCWRRVATRVAHAPLKVPGTCHDTSTKTVFLTALN